MIQAFLMYYHISLQYMSFEVVFIWHFYVSRRSNISHINIIIRSQDQIISPSIFFSSFPPSLYQTILISGLKTKLFHVHKVLLPTIHLTLSFLLFFRLFTKPFFFSTLEWLTLPFSFIQKASSLVAVCQWTSLSFVFSVLLLSSYYVREKLLFPFLSQGRYWNFFFEEDNRSSPFFLEERQLFILIEVTCSPSLCFDKLEIHVEEE